MVAGIEGPIPLSPVTEAGGALYVSGQIPVDEQGQLVGGDVGAQTERVLRNVARVLEGVGASLADVVKTTVFLAEPKRDFGPMNEAYARFWPGRKPSRTTVGAVLAVDALVEIEAVAVRGAGERG